MQVSRYPPAQRKVSARKRARATYHELSSAIPNKKKESKKKREREKGTEQRGFLRIKKKRKRQTFSNASTLLTYRKFSF